MRLKALVKTVELVIADRAACFGERASEADQRIAMDIARGLAIADLLELLRLQRCELAEQAVRGDAVFEAGDAADDQLDAFLIALRQCTRSEGIGGKHRLGRRASMGADHGGPLAFAPISFPVGRFAVAG